MRKGQLITIEGIHGAGKTTAIQHILPVLKSLGLKITYAKDQSETKIGKQIRKVNLESKTAVDPYTETFLVSAARREAFMKVIQPRLATGQHVISERFIDAFFAFGHARSLHKKLLETLSHFTCNGTLPGLTLLLDLPPKVAQRRIKLQRPHRVEREPLGFHKLLREGYLIQARKNPGRIVVINANVPASQVAEQIIKIIGKRLSVTTLS